jgi:Helix-turn-helix domain
MMIDTGHHTVAAHNVDALGYCARVSLDVPIVSNERSTKIAMSSTKRVTDMSERKPQFGRVPTAIVTSGVLAQVKPAACRVYLCLCARANRQWQTYVGVRRLANDTGHCTGTISEAVGQLRELGLITTNGYVRGRRYIYTITYMCSALAEQSTVQRKPNTSRKKCSGPAGPTVQRPPGKALSPSRTKQREQSKNSMSTPTAKTPSKAAPNTAAVFTFQTTTGPWPFTTAQRDKFRDAYPFVHVDTELAGLADWTDANPDKRKKPGAMFGWLRRLMATKQTERPLPTAAVYADGFQHTSLPTDPTPEQLDEILNDAV